MTTAIRIPEELLPGLRARTLHEIGQKAYTLQQATEQLDQADEFDERRGRLEEMFRLLDVLGPAVPTEHWPAMELVIDAEIETTCGSGDMSPMEPDELIAAARKVELLQALLANEAVTA